MKKFLKPVIIIFTALVALFGATAVFASSPSLWMLPDPGKLYNPSTSVSTLHQMFGGLIEYVMGVNLESGNTHLFADILSYWNVLIASGAAVFIIYHVVLGFMKSAESGRFLGGENEKVGSILRYSVGGLFIAPIIGAGKFCLMQYLFMYFILVGVHGANILWGEATDKITIGVTPTIPSDVTTSLNNIVGQMYLYSMVDQYIAKDIEDNDIDKTTGSTDQKETFVSLEEQPGFESVGHALMSNHSYHYLKNLQDILQGQGMTDAEASIEDGAVTLTLANDLNDRRKLAAYLRRNAQTTYGGESGTIYSCDSNMGYIEVKNSNGTVIGCVPNPLEKELDGFTSYTYVDHYTPGQWVVEDVKFTNPSGNEIQIYDASRSFIGGSQGGGVGNDDEIEHCDEGWNLTDDGKCERVVSQSFSAWTGKLAGEACSAWSQNRKNEECGRLQGGRSDAVSVECKTHLRPPPQYSDMRCYYPEVKGYKPVIDEDSYTKAGFEKAVLIDSGSVGASAGSNVTYRSDGMPMITPGSAQQTGRQNERQPALIAPIGLNLGSIPSNYSFPILAGGGALYYSSPKTLEQADCTYYGENFEPDGKGGCYRKEICANGGNPDKGCRFFCSGIKQYPDGIVLPYGEGEAQPDAGYDPGSDRQWFIHMTGGPAYSRPYYQDEAEDYFGGKWVYGDKNGSGCTMRCNNNGSFFSFDNMPESCVDACPDSNEKWDHKQGKCVAQYSCPLEATSVGWWGNRTGKYDSIVGTVGPGSALPHESLKKYGEGGALGICPQGQKCQLRLRCMLIFGGKCNWGSDRRYTLGCE